MLDEKTMQAEISKLEGKITDLEGKRAAAIEDLEQKRDEAVEKLNQKIKETRDDYKDRIANSKDDFDGQIGALKSELKQRNAMLVKYREFIGQYESIGTSEPAKPAKKKKKKENTKGDDGEVQPIEQPIADAATELGDDIFEEDEIAETKVENEPKRGFFGGF